MVDEPVETKAPFREARLATDKVEEADNGPAICKELEIVEEAWAMKPLEAVSMVVEAVAKEEWPETVSEPRVPTLVSEEPVTAEPKAVADKVFAPLMAKKFPVARFRELET